jgi:hypothetical protein
VRQRARTLPAWGGLVATSVLVTRALVYALANSTPLTERLSGRLGGPRPLVVTGVALGVGVAAAVTALWLASLGVRERWALADPMTRGVRPRLDLRRFALRAGGLWVATALGFAAVENYVHWRAGLGLHGLDCLVGPVHVNAVPITAALALAGAGAIGAAEHLLRWARRVVARVLGARPRAPRRRPVLPAPPAAVRAPRPVFSFEPLLPRPPPAPAR